MPKEKVVTVGGGNGSPVINEALLRTNNVEHINAIAAVFDSGGATGRRRLDSLGHEIAYSDPMRILFSLVHPETIESETVKTVKEMFNHRDEKDRVLGQDILNRFSDEQNGFFEVEEKVRTLGIDLKGHVLPSSTQPSNIMFTTSLGREYIGEHFFDEQRMSKDMVDTMSLAPEVDAYPPSTEAIKKAKVIFLASGSLHGSVLANFLPNGMKEALSESQAKMYLVTNLVSTRNETHNFTPKDFVNVVETYTGKRPDGLIVPEITRKQFESRYPRASLLYDSEHSHFLGWEHDELQRFRAEEGVEIFAHQAIKVLDKGKERVVRHDPQKLATTLRRVLPAKEV